MWTRLTNLPIRERAVQVANGAITPLFGRSLF